MGVGQNYITKKLQVSSLSPFTRFHVGYLFLTHSHMVEKVKGPQEKPLLKLLPSDSKAANGLANGPIGGRHRNAHRSTSEAHARSCSREIRIRWYQLFSGLSVLVGEPSPKKGGKKGT